MGYEYYRPAISATTDVTEPALVLAVTTTTSMSVASVTVTPLGRAVRLGILTDITGRKR